MDSPLKRPIIQIRGELFTERIFPDVNQLLLVFDAVAHPAMKRFALPRPRFSQMTPAELAFPEFHPLVYPEMQIARRAEEMQVIRHEEVKSDEPRGRLCAPDFRERILD